MRRKIRPFSILLGSFLVISSLVILSSRVFHFNNNVNSQQDFSANANQYLQEHGQNFPLLIQTDSRWADKSYGSGSAQNDLATNGCGITSLAMILSYWEHRTVYPTEILQWSGNQYYQAGQGTAWSIMVIKKDLQSDQIIVYDPNDGPDKEHYMKKYSIDELMSQLANAWAYTK